MHGLDFLDFQLIGQFDFLFYKPEIDCRQLVDLQLLEYLALHLIQSFGPMELLRTTRVATRVGVISECGSVTLNMVRLLLQRYRSCTCFVHTENGESCTKWTLSASSRAHSEWDRRECSVVSR